MMVFSKSVPANITHTMATLRCATARFDQVYGIIILSNISMTIFQMSSWVSFMERAHFLCFRKIWLIDLIVKSLSLFHLHAMMKKKHRNAYESNMNSNDLNNLKNIDSAQSDSMRRFPWIPIVCCLTLKMSNMPSVFHSNNTVNNKIAATLSYFFEKKFNSFLFLSIFLLLHSVHSYNEATRRIALKPDYLRRTAFTKPISYNLIENYDCLENLTLNTYIVHGFLWYIMWSSVIMSA